MDSLLEPPPGLDLDETKVPALVSAFVVTWIMGFLCVGLRIAVRRLAGNKLWWDDWLIIVSLVFSAAFMLDVTCYMVGRGRLGRHIWVAPRDARRIYFLGLFVGQLLCGISIMLIKFSILAFFWRIFGTSRASRWSIWVISAIVCAWGIAVIIVGIFQCSPVSASWSRFDPDVPESAYKCPVDVRVFFLANGALNTATDILLIMVPIPNLWSLQLRKPQKMALLGVFTVGLFVIGVSIVRIYYVAVLDLYEPDFTWTSSEETMWTGVENNVGTVCACLPSLRKLLSSATYDTSQRLSGGSHSAIATIGGSGSHCKKDRGIRLNTLDCGTLNSGRMCKGQPEDTHPLSAVSDNGSDTWAELGSRHVEMHHMSKGDDGRWGISRTVR